jgi:hypothetical protein
MLKQLLIITCIVSTTYGVDDINQPIQPMANPINSSNQTGHEIPRTITEELDALRITLSQHQSSDTEIIDAILNLFSIVNYESLSVDRIDPAIDTYSSIYTHVIQPSEVQSFIEEFKPTLLASLQRFIASEHPWTKDAEYWFFISVLNNNALPSVLSSLICDKVLDQIESWLKSSKVEIRILSLYCFYQFVENVREKAHIERMQKIVLSYFDEFINAYLVPVHILLLAKMDPEYTLNYVTELHRLILKSLFFLAMEPSSDQVDDAIEITITLFLLLEHFRDNVVKTVLSKIFVFPNTNQIIDQFPELETSQLFLEGNQSFRQNRLEAKTQEEIEDAANAFIHRLMLELEINPSNGVERCIEIYKTQLFNSGIFNYKDD